MRDLKVLGGRWILYGAVTALGILSLNSGTSYVALKRLERKTGSPIQGRFIPHPFLPAFSVKNPSLNWQDRFQVISGNFQVSYDPLSLLPGRKFRVQIQGENLSVRLLGKLAESEGFGQVEVDHVEADLAFPRKGPPDIFLFDVQSPQIQFHLGPLRDRTAQP